MIWIDFRGGTHGYFLEYVTNVWIMKMPSESSSVFTDTGACHNFSNYYKNNRKVKGGHWWWSNYTHQKIDEPVIRINFNRFNSRSFYIALVNRWYRSGDVSFDQKLLHTEEHIRNSPSRFRNQYYHKYISRNGFGDFIKIPNPIQEFEFESFFIWSEFCRELHNIAKFLNQTFIPDQNLYKLWQEFIRLNQGYQSYHRCEDILENIFLEKLMPVNCTTYEEAWINYNITGMTGLDSGLLFNNDVYPANTFEIYKLITQHV